ncbi:MAG: pentapeptide repeat-containing protein [Leptolyngbyaceae cyanobacterium MO_188.B28]|nr:pentapeptide repeat-containing protein [Leptolyngbyaceae cyanobacterium MO_188.B28]
MITKNSTKNKQEPTHSTHSSEQLGSKKFIPKDEETIHLLDDTERLPGSFGWVEKIWIPVGIGLVGVVATGIGTFFGFELSELQRSNAEAERIIERASKASSARQEVLTNYAARITDLISENKLTRYDPNDSSLQPIRNAIRGESIIALKRLDDGRGEGKGEIDLLKDKMAATLGLNSDQNQPLATEDLEGFNDSGKLKGELVRFLYASRLLTGVNEENSEASLLRGADLTRVVLSSAHLPDINLRRAWISWGQLDHANLQGSDLRGADLYAADLQKTNLAGANLGWSDLREANLRGANLYAADLRQANLMEINFGGANLQEANLRGADLQEANLQEANLQGANLHEADLQEAGLSGSNLGDVRLENANLSNANLKRANLQRANLSAANLRGADLRGADLHGADLEEANLRGACYDQSTTRGLTNIDPESLGMRNATNAPLDIVCMDLPSGN